MTKLKTALTSVPFLLVLFCLTVSAFTITTFDILKVNSVRYVSSGDGTHYVSMLSNSSLAANKTHTLASVTGTTGVVTGATTSGHLAAFTATSGELVDGGAVGATCPGTASTTEVLYNNAGVCDGISGVTSDGTNMTAGAGNLRATSPRITTSIFDANGLALVGLTATATAVNSVNIANAATGNNPVISAIGTNTDIGVTLTPKGAGALVLNGPSQSVGLLTASAGIGITGSISATADLTLTAVGNITNSTAVVQPNVSITDNGTTLATNAHLGNNFRSTALTANVTLSNPTNPVDGQVVTWEIIQNAAAAKTLAFGAAFGFGAEITGCTISATLSSHDFITAIYNSTTAKWYVRGCLTGY